MFFFLPQLNRSPNSKRSTTAIARSTSGVILVPTNTIYCSASGSVTTIVGTTNSPGHTPSPSSVSPISSVSSSSSPPSPGLSTLPSNEADCRRSRFCLRANNSGLRLPTKKRVRLLPLRPVGLGIWERHEAAPRLARFPNNHILTLLRLRGFGCRRAGGGRWRRRWRLYYGNNVCRVAV